MTDDEKADEISSVSESEEVVATNPLPDVDHTEVPPPFRAYVGGLSNKCRPENLAEFLKKVDPNVSHVIIAKNKGTGGCRGFAHVSFSTPQLRQRAIGSLAGQTFLGRKIRIEEADEHFVAKRKREDEEGPLLKRSRRDIDAEEKAKQKQKEEAEWNSWNSWGNTNSSWDDGRRVQQGTQKRWEPGQPTAPKPAMSARRAELERQKADAVAREDFGEAARIKKELESEDVVDKLRAQKQAAVDREDFEEAGRLKKEIETLENGGAPAAAPAPAAPAAAAAPAAPAAAAPAPAPAAAAVPVAAKPAPKKKAEKKQPQPVTPKGDKGCKRCLQGKPCGKHGSDGPAGPRCKKCNEGQSCMKHKPEEALAMQRKAVLEEASAPTPAKAEAQPAAQPTPAPAARAQTKKAAPKRAAPSSAPKTMEALLATNAGSQSFMACMDDDI